VTPEDYLICPFCDSPRKPIKHDWKGRENEVFLRCINRSCNRLGSVTAETWRKIVGFPVRGGAKLLMSVDDAAHFGGEPGIPGSYPPYADAKVEAIAFFTAHAEWMREQWELTPEGREYQKRFLVAIEAIKA